MKDFKWTSKRKAALEYLIRAGGNVRLAAEMSANESVSVSYGYLNELKYAEKYQPFREEYRRRTGQLLHALEVDTEFVIKGLVELTRPDIPPGTGRRALRDLGDYLGIWDQKKGQVAEDDWTEVLIEAIQRESDPERRE